MLHLQVSNSRLITFKTTANSPFAETIGLGPNIINRQNILRERANTKKLTVPITIPYEDILSTHTLRTEERLAKCSRTPYHYLAEKKSELGGWKPETRARPSSKKLPVATSRNSKHPPSDEKTQGRLTSAIFYTFPSTSRNSAFLLQNTSPAGGHTAYLIECHGSHSFPAPPADNKQINNKKRTPSSQILNQGPTDNTIESPESLLDRMPSLIFQAFIDRPSPAQHVDMLAPTYVARLAAKRTLGYIAVEGLNDNFTADPIADTIAGKDKDGTASEEGILYDSLPNNDSVTITSPVNGHGPINNRKSRVAKQGQLRQSQSEEPLSPPDSDEDTGGSTIPDAAQGKGKRKDVARVSAPEAGNGDYKPPQVHENLKKTAWWI